MKHQKQQSDLLRLALLLTKENEEDILEVLAESLILLEDACCVEIYMRASSLFLQAMATQVMLDKQASSDELLFGRALAKASHRPLSLLSTIQRVPVMSGGHTLN